MADHSTPQTGMLLIISGPSGVGKTTITRAIERSELGSVFSVSVTTRPKTREDCDGVDYRFVTDAEFDAMVERDELLEHANVFGHKYGTPRAWVQQHLDQGRLVILEIDVQGATQVKAKLPDAYAIFVLPPSEASLLERLRARKREDEAAIQRRFAEAKREMEQARSGGVYDAFVVNSDRERAIDEVRDLVRAARAARAGSARVSE